VKKAHFLLFHRVKLPWGRPIRNQLVLFHLFAISQTRLIETMLQTLPCVTGEAVIATLTPARIADARKRKTRIA
jgi:hypothetical protein